MRGSQFKVSLAFAYDRLFVRISPGRGGASTTLISFPEIPMSPIVTDTAGEYLVYQPEGDIRINAGMPGYFDQSSMVSVIRGEEVRQDFDLETIQKAGLMSGRIVDPDGNPLAAVITISPVDTGVKVEKIKRVPPREGEQSQPRERQPESPARPEAPGSPIPTPANPVPPTSFETPHTSWSAPLIESASKMVFVPGETARISRIITVLAAVGVFQGGEMIAQAGEETP